MMAARVAGVPSAQSFHLFADFFILNLPPRMAPCPAECWRRYILSGGLVWSRITCAFSAAPLIADSQRGQPLLVVIRFLFAAFPGFVPAVNGLPAFLGDSLARAQKIVFTAGRNHAQRVVFVIGIKHRCQPPGHHFIQLSLVSSQIHVFRALARWNNRVVIGEFRVVKHAFGHPHAVGKRLFADGLQRAVVSFQRRLYLAEHIVGKIAAVRSRIGEQLVLFIELLRSGQRLLRREPQLSVGLAAGALVRS